MTNYQPQPGERVLAVLPDGHEIEAEYRCAASDGTHLMYLHGDRAAGAYVRSVKPLPSPEPTVFGACVIDRQGKRWIRDEHGYWRSEERLMRWGWRALLADFAPVRVVNADPWSES